MKAHEPIDYAEAKSALMQMAQRLGGRSARLIEIVVERADESDATIGLLSQQLADKREIIRKLTS